MERNRAIERSTEQPLRYFYVGHGVPRNDDRFDDRIQAQPRAKLSRQPCSILDTEGLAARSRTDAARDVRAPSNFWAVHRSTGGEARDIGESRCEDGSFGFQVKSLRVHVCTGPIRFGRSQAQVRHFEMR